MLQPKRQFLLLMDQNTKIGWQTIRKTISGIFNRQSIFKHIVTYVLISLHSHKEQMFLMEQLI